MSAIVLPQSILHIRYRIFDTQGELLESTEGDEIDEVELGQGELPEAVEAALVGQSVGKTVRIEASEPFGPREAENVVSIPHDSLDGEVAAEPGDIIPILLEPEEGDEDAEPEEVEVLVVEVNDDGIMVDLNHMYAGMDLVFEVDIVEVQ